MIRPTVGLGLASLVAALLSSACGGDEPLGPRVRLILEPQPGAEANLQIELSEALDEVVSVVERRLSEVDPVSVERDGDRRVVIEMPGTEDEALTRVGRTAFLQFCEPLQDASGNIAIVRAGTVAYEQQTCAPTRGADGDIILDEGHVEFVRWPTADTDNIIWTPATAEIDGQELELTGEYLRPNTSVQISQFTNEPLLIFEWNGIGSEISGAVTERLVAEGNLPLAPFLDGEPILGEDGHIIAPVVQSQITSQASISGLSSSEAEELSALLNAGSYPIAMEVVEVQDGVTRHDHR